MSTTAETTRINVYYTGQFSHSGLDCIEGVNVVSSVDIVNRNGTGVACLDCENSEYVTESLDQMECVESYSVR